MVILVSVIFLLKPDIPDMIEIPPGVCLLVGLIYSSLSVIIISEGKSDDEDIEFDLFNDD